MAFARRWCCALAPVVLWSQTSSGTTGVAIWTPNRAVLAIDSRVTLTAGDVVRRGTDECKLKSLGRFFVAIAGLYDHAATRFDAWSLAEEDVAGAGSVSEAAAQAERRIVPELRTAMWNMQASDLAGFARHYTQAHMAILVAGMERGAPAMAGREFLPDRNAAIQVVRWETAPGTASIFVFGEHGAIDRAYGHEVHGQRKGLSDLIGSLGPAEAARSLVQLEIAGAPQSVGPPIAILQIGDAGPAWIERGLCGFGAAQPLP